MNNSPFARAARFALPAIVLLILAGCASPRTQFYLLTPAANVPPLVTDGDRHLQVATITLADYLSRSQMVIREQANEVKYLDSHRWAEPLDQNIRAVLIQNLSKQFPGWSLSQPKGIPAPKSFITVHVSILKFEGLDGGNAVMEAQWDVVKQPEGRHAQKSAVFERPFKRAKHVTLAEALSAMLEELARDIAVSIEEIEKQP